MKIVLLDILDDNTYNFHRFLHSNCVDYYLKSTYEHLGLNKILKANQEVIFWLLLTSTSGCLTYMA